MTDDELRRECSDANCVWRSPFQPSGGQQTNGGCEHLKLSPAYTRRLVQIMAGEIRSLRTLINELGPTL
jgi:hypothetical protein